MLKYIILALMGAWRPSSKLIVNMFSLCTSWNKTKIIRGFSKKFNGDRILMETSIWKFYHSKTFPGVPRCPTKKLGPIGSAVLTFIGYKQTNKQTDKPNLYIDARKNIRKLFVFVLNCTKRRCSQIKPQL